MKKSKYLTELKSLSRRDVMKLMLQGAIGAGAGGPLIAAFNTAAADSGDPNRPLVIAVPTDPEGLDPDGGAEKMTFTINRHLNSFLTRFKVNDQGDGMYRFDRTVVEPLLADSFDISEGGTLLTFVIKDGLQFPSGNPFTMDDVVYSFERMLGAGMLGAFELGVGSITSMDQLSVKDSRTFTVKLPQADPMIQRVLGLVSIAIYDSKLIKAEATADDPWSVEWAKQNASGFGPYVLDEYVVGREFILAPNPHHPEPGELKLIFKIVPASENRALLLERGDVDMALAVPERLMSRLDGKAGIRVLARPGLYVDNVTINNSMPPFDNPKVRQALSYAVPYERIIKEVYYGYAEAAYGPVMKGLPGHDADAWIYSEDLDKARSLLAEAGHPNGFDTEINISDSLPRWAPIAQLLQENFAKVGINARIQSQTLSALSEKLFARSMPLSIGGGIPWLADPWYALFLWCHSGGYGNFDSYNNPEVDKLIEKLRFTPEPERTVLAGKIQRVVINDAPRLYLGQPMEAVVLRDDVTGYLFTGEDSDFFSRLNRS
jgi:peptide/nickel transport system substrate-binding protein